MREGEAAILGTFDRPADSSPGYVGNAVSEESVRDHAAHIYDMLDGYHPMPPSTT
ncbi:hypothetical protein GCM10009733_020780 [Nonomuraea maheshkhaliensis]|uniref:Uncharacterized protein n=1 Tax=Nonomuraea maheshkhaliensis TaxID=419590 RepID=A0ABN2EZP5_9ACTN